MQPENSKPLGTIPEIPPRSLLYCLRRWVKTFFIANFEHSVLDSTTCIVKSAAFFGVGIPILFIYLLIMFVEGKH